jgi:iron complex transport system ATP-binding protein
MDLSVRNLTVSLGERIVLRDVTARFEAGKVTAILGTGGSGKTTLLRAMAGLLTPDAGHILLDGRATARIARRDRERMIGFLPHGGAIRGNPRVRDLAADAAGLAGRRLAELSGGERAAVLLAHALASEPRWLLADDPLAGLDPVGQLEQLDRLRAAAEHGTGVVIVLNDILQAARAADQVLLLKRGEVVAFGPTREALAHQPLRDAFGLEVMVVADSAGNLLPVPMGRTG